MASIVTTEADQRLTAHELTGDGETHLCVLQTVLRLEVDWAAPSRSRTSLWAWLARACDDEGAVSPVAWGLSAATRFADTRAMPFIGRVLLAVLLLVALALCGTSGSAVAAPEVGVSDGEHMLFRVVTDPTSGRGVAILGRMVPDGYGYFSSDLFSTPLSRSGVPSGSITDVGGGMKPDAGYGPIAAMAVGTDSRRGRHLVVWPAHKPGMGRTPCAPAQSSPTLTFPNEPTRSCATADTEMFARVVDRAGRPLGRERQISSIGPRDSGLFGSAAPTVAYDARDDSFLVVFAGRATGDAISASLFAQRLRPDGTPLGAARVLGLQPTPLSAGPLSQLIADPRGGYRLAYTWGAVRDRRLYTRRLTRAGSPTGSTNTLSQDAVGEIELVSDRRRKRVLIVYGPGLPGMTKGVRARLLTSGGRPLADAVTLPFELPAVASDPVSGGWAYGFIEERAGLARQLLVQRAGATGRPAGRVQEVSRRDVSAGLPAIAAVPGGTLFVAWNQNEIDCAGDTPPACYEGARSIRARHVRP